MNLLNQAVTAHSEVLILTAAIIEGNQVNKIITRKNTAQAPKKVLVSITEQQEGTILLSFRYVIFFILENLLAIAVWIKTFIKKRKGNHILVIWENFLQKKTTAIFLT